MKDESKPTKELPVNNIRRDLYNLFQTLIARNYNNIGKWHNQVQQYNLELIQEVEKILIDNPSQPAPSEEVVKDDVVRWKKAESMIHQLPVVKSNFQYIAETGVINGSLLADLTRMMYGQMAAHERVSDLEALVKELTEALEDVCRAWGSIKKSEAALERGKSALSKAKDLIK